MNNDIVAQSEENIIVNPNPICKNQNPNSLFDCLKCNLSDCTTLTAHTDTIHLQRVAFKVTPTIVDIPDYMVSL